MMNMRQTEIVPSNLRVFMEQVYQYKKGVRQMVLQTLNKQYEQAAVQRLRRQNIAYVLQSVGNNCVNLFFGRKECIDAISLIVRRPLNELTAEEDFILGAMLGYDICIQCERYCKRKGSCRKS